MVLGEILHSPIYSKEDSSLLVFHSTLLRDQLEHLKSSFPGNVFHTVAIKTNPVKGILKQCIDMGYGLEAASMEELLLAKSLGIRSENLVFDSPVKTKEEIKYCELEFPGMIVNANHLQELPRFKPSTSLRLGLRINPLISVSDHSSYDVSTSLSKFGEPIENREQILEAFVKYPLQGLHVHSGSSIDDPLANVKVIERVMDLLEDIHSELETRGIDRRITFLDIGGGLHPDVGKEGMTQYGNALRNSLEKLGIQIVTEFGQWIQRPTMTVFSKVEYVVQRDGKQMAFLHVGADLFLRDTYQRRRGYEYSVYGPGGEPKEQKPELTILAGPLCFAGDILEPEIDLPPCHEGDWIGIGNAGANTIGLWSRHCSRDIPKILMEEESGNIKILQDRTRIWDL